MSRTAGFSERLPGKGNSPVTGILESTVRAVDFKPSGSGPESPWQAPLPEQNRTFGGKRSSEEKYAKAFQNNPCPMFISRIDNGRYVDVNGSFCRATGYSRRELLNNSSNVMNLWSGDQDGESLMRNCPEYESSGSREIFFYNKAGEECSALLNTETFSTNGQTFYIGAMFDFGEQRQVMREMERLASLHLVGELASSLAHEVRNPLTTVRGFLQMMSENQSCSVDRDNISLMIAELDRSNAIIGEFLFFAREKGLELELLSLKSIIEEMAPILQAGAQMQDKSIQLDLQDTPAFFMDKAEIEQMVLRLVQNGLEMLPANQNLGISTCRQNGETVLLVRGITGTVSSNRISNNNRFPPGEFGTGLGISLCHSIAARHQAVLEINPAVPGAVFQVRFRY